MRGRKRPVSTAQLGLPFEGPKPPPKAKKVAKRVVRRTGRSLAERRAIKDRALRLARQAYALLSKRPDLLQREEYKKSKKEIGKDVGALRGGRATTEQAQAAINRAKDVLDAMGVKYRP